MQRTKQRILSVIDATQERVRKGSNAAGCFAALRSEIEMLDGWIAWTVEKPEEATPIVAFVCNPDGSCRLANFGQAHIPLIEKLFKDVLSCLYWIKLPEIEKSPT